jgi:uncharacterized membrane protein
MKWSVILGFVAGGFCFVAGLFVLLKEWTISETPMNEQFFTTAAIYIVGGLIVVGLAEIILSLEKRNHQNE